MWEKCDGSDSFANAIAKLCYKHFDSLPKTGKPQLNKEWTLLSAIVITRHNNADKIRELKVIAMSTGTKCLGHSLLSEKGELVNDSHAEVLTRRAFLRYLYRQLSLVLKNKESEILECKAPSSYILKPDIKIHLFISHTPCGDASIFLKAEAESSAIKRPLEEDMTMCSKKLKLDESQVEDTMKVKNEILCEGLESDDKKLVLSTDINIANSKAAKTRCSCYCCRSAPDTFRTGAKCVKDGKQDPKGEGMNYHVIGTLRTKPGRGDPTWSMSCSDKIAMWNVCGLQGALISHFLPYPLYLSSVVIGKCPFSEEALHRAIIDRTSNIRNLPEGYCKANSSTLQSDLTYEFCKEKVEELGVKVVPCAAAVIWCDVPHKPLEVGVNGRKQGITKKSFQKSSSWLMVCRRWLFEEFLKLIDDIPKERVPETVSAYELVSAITELRPSVPACGYPGQEEQMPLWHVVTGHLEAAVARGLFTVQFRHLSANRNTYLDYKKAAHAYQAAKCAFLEGFQGWMLKPYNLQMFKHDIKLGQ